VAKNAKNKALFLSAFTAKRILLRPRGKQEIKWKK